MTHAPPSPEQQIRFLTDIQRILDEGGFVATYKYALLHTLADLCLLHGDDSGAPLDLTTRDIAAGYIELYWRQTLPYPKVRGLTHLHGQVLKQNTGEDPVIVKRILEAQTEIGHTEGALARLKRSGKRMSKLVTKVNQTIRRYPLQRLQTLQSGQNEFLYHWDPKSPTITLKSGVAFCFRSFYSLLVNLIRGAWTGYIRRFNGHLLAETVDLEAFLFGSDRSPLTKYRDFLMDLQSGQCFYCGKNIGNNAAVDHFIPWSKFPHDLGHNFVLADSTCNSHKSDHLASERHLEAWVERNADEEKTLVSWFEQEDEVYDVSQSVSVAQWAYSHAYRSGARAWAAGDRFEDLSPNWETIIGKLDMH